MTQTTEDRNISFGLVILLAAVVIGPAAIWFGRRIDRLEKQNNEILARLMDIREQKDRPAAGASDGSRRIEEKVDAILDIFQRAMEEQKKQQQVRTRLQQEEYTTRHEIPVGRSPVLGPQDAPITITEFIDFQCPYCARFHGAVIAAQRARPKQVKVVIKNYPLSFHPHAKEAAKAALAAGEQGKYFEMADLLLKSQRRLSPSLYEELAERLGLDVERFKRDLEQKDEVYESLIQEDMRLGQKVDVRGTPTMYINGVKTRARSKEAYLSQIDRLLAQQTDPDVLKPLSP